MIKGEEISKEIPTAPALTVQELTQIVDSELPSLKADVLKTRLDKDMEKFPGLSTYVQGHMADGLIAEEEILIGETAWAVFHYCQENNIKPEPIGEDDATPDISDLPTLAMVLDDEGLLLEEDRNRIFHYIKDYMEDRPELAQFLVSMMEKSVSLQEANIVGRTGLTVYQLATYPFAPTQH